MSKNNDTVYNLDDLGYINDALSAYLRYIKNFPPLPSEEIYRLGVRVSQGDNDAREKLILHHLAYVVYVAKPYFHYYRNVDPMDIIQYGNEGLMIAVSKYNPNEGALTTYAGPWIQQRITRYLDKDHTDIATPIHIQEAAKRYKKIRNKVEAGIMQMPSDEELSKLFNMSLESVNLVKNFVDTSVVSINTSVDDDGTELGDLLELETVERPEDIIFSVDRFDILIALKEKLRPVHYYVFYMRNLDTEPHTLEELAQELGVTRERVRQLDLTAKEKIDKIINKKYSKVQKINSETKLREKAKFSLLNEKPLQPKEIIKYLYLCRFFSGISKDILKDIFIHRYKMTFKDCARKYSITEKEFRAVYEKLRVRVREILKKNKDDFINFKHDMITTYQSSIFEIDLNKEFNTIDYQDILQRYSSLSFNDICNLYGDDFDKLPEDSKRLLHRYFDVPNSKIVDTNFIEREVNLSLFNYRDTNTKLSSATLLPTYNMYKDKFNDEQQLLLECYFFNKKNKALYDEKKHATPRNILLPYVVQKLERYHYGLHKTFLYQNLTKEMYEEVLETRGDAITDERKRILNLYFGVGTKKMSLMEIVKKYNLDYVKTHDFLRHAREYVYNLYINRANKKKIDKDLYEKYITNVAYELTMETRNILKMHVIQGLTYEQISKKTKLTKYRIANIVSEGIRKIDFYRFGIINAMIIDEKRLALFFEKSTVKFSDIEKAIVYLRFIKHLNTDDILISLTKDNRSYDQKNNITKTSINRTTSKFINTFNSFVVSDVELTKSEISEFIDRAPIESTILDIEKRILSLIYGIKNSFNPTGLEYSTNEITEMLNITVNQFFHYKLNGIKKLKMTKVGLLKPNDIYMPIKELKNALMDIHTPISEKERLIINHFCNLNGYAKKSFKEIAKITNDTENSTRRRYQRAIVSILKYLNKEIEGIIDFETDIVPILKYFCRSDQIYITEHYKNGLSYEAIAKKHKSSMDRIVSVFDSIILRLHDIKNNPKEKRFDYDYAEKVLDNTDLPFFGNIDIARKLYRCIFLSDTLDRVPVTEAVKALNLDMTVAAGNVLLIEFMVSICKYRSGIKQNVSFSYEQIKDYFDRNKDNINSNKLKTYNVYFNRYNNKSYSLLYTYVNDTIKYDLLKDKKLDYFKISTASRDEVLKILKDKDFKIDKRVRLSLMQLFDISEREFMSGQDINHVIRLLHLLDLQLNSIKDINLIEQKELKRDI